MVHQPEVIQPAVSFQPKGVDIDVIADPKVGGTIEWSLDIKTKDHGKGNKIELPKDDNFKLTFNLVDRTGQKLRFDASAPFFCREGGLGPCPTDISTPQVMVDSCNAGTLVVIDWNYGDPRELYYQLNFTNEKGLIKRDYDPPITNGGGGTEPLVEA